MSLLDNLRDHIRTHRDDPEMVIHHLETVEDSREYVGQVFGGETIAHSPVLLALCEAAGVEEPEPPHQPSCAPRECDCNGGCNCSIR